MGSNGIKHDCDLDDQATIVQQPSKRRKDEKSVDQFDYTEIQRMLPEQFDDLYKTLPLTEDTSCGIWIFKGDWLQKCANKKVYVFLYGIVGCIFSATYAYFNGTITTLEKRYKIPSRNTGIISVGNDISQLLVSAALSYYAGKGHRPRWMAFGLLTIAAFCIMNILPHFLYGPGEDALALTEEYGAQMDENYTLNMFEQEKHKKLCEIDGNRTLNCDSNEGNYAPQVILFIAQFISGIGQPLYYTLGVSYMDDNILKSKTPTFISLSYFIRMLGPALGYTLASMCLKLYISPSLKPTITNLDPRWLGAWWLGWVILGAIMTFSAFLIAMFPKTLPRAAVRRVIHQERIRRELSIIQPKEEEASLRDMFITFKRLLHNGTLMLNNISSLFYFFGYIPYWTFTPKYIETMYRQSASVSSLVTGTVALAFSAIGVLSSGFIISKYKPSARSMAAWNVIVGTLTVLGMLSYTMLGCADNERGVVENYGPKAKVVNTCSSDCDCGYVKYSPVCGEDRNSYFSACHAGCKELVLGNGNQIFVNCSCIDAGHVANFTPVETWLEKAEYKAYGNVITDGINEYPGGVAIPGVCPVNCFREFLMFLAVMCFLKFIGATGRATNFLVGVRCVEEKDKPVAMGFGLMFMALFAFIPSPIFFGALLDRSCLVWRQTCEGTGNCWLYNGEALRYSLNIIAAIFVAIGVLFDGGVWYLVKDLKIFDDDEPNDTPLTDLTEKDELVEKDTALAKTVNNIDTTK